MHRAPYPRARHRGNAPPTDARNNAPSSGRMAAGAARPRTLGSRGDAVAPGHWRRGWRGGRAPAGRGAGGSEGGRAGGALAGAGPDGGGAPPPRRISPRRTAIESGDGRLGDNSHRRRRHVQVLDLAARGAARSPSRAARPGASSGLELEPDDEPPRPARAPSAARAADRPGPSPALGTTCERRCACVCAKGKTKSTAAWERRGVARRRTATLGLEASLEGRRCPGDLGPKSPHVFRFARPFLCSRSPSFEARSIACNSPTLHLGALSTLPAAWAFGVQPLFADANPRPPSPSQAPRCATSLASGTIGRAR